MKLKGRKCKQLHFAHSWDSIHSFSFSNKMGGSGSKEPKEPKEPKAEKMGKRSGSMLENKAAKDMRQTSSSSLPIEPIKDQKSKKVCGWRNSLSTLFF
jgi:hypothetical protein